jgi:hypothetical protein
MMVIMTFQNKQYIQNIEYERHKLKYGMPQTIRFNDEETDIINKWSEEADIGSSSEAVKTLMKIGYYVIHGQSIAPTLSRLFKKERSRKP